VPRVRFRLGPGEYGWYLWTTSKPQPGIKWLSRNLGRALLSVFSSVSVEIALWRHVFLGLDGFSCRKSCFSKNLYYGTLHCPWMSISVNVFLELVGLVSITDREFGAQIEIWPFRWVIMRFPRRNQQILTEWQIGESASFNPWVIYVCSDVINEHERVCREHGIYNTVLIHS
jgi:hypothetical protein